MTKDYVTNPEIVCSCFFNATFNIGQPDGPSKFVWGIKDLDFSQPIDKQILAETKFADAEIFNFNITALNEIGVLNNIIDMNVKGDK